MQTTKPVVGTDIGKRHSLSSIAQAVCPEAMILHAVRSIFSIHLHHQRMPHGASRMKSSRVAAFSDDVA